MRCRCLPLEELCVPEPRQFSLHWLWELPLVSLGIRRDQAWGLMSNRRRRRWGTGAHGCSCGVAALRPGSSGSAVSCGGTGLSPASPSCPPALGSALEAASPVCVSIHSCSRSMSATPGRCDGGFGSLPHRSRCCWNFYPVTFGTECRRNLSRVLGICPSVFVSVTGVVSRDQPGKPALASGEILLCPTAERSQILQSPGP